MLHLDYIIAGLSKAVLLPLYIFHIDKLAQNWVGYPNGRIGTLSPTFFLTPDSLVIVCHTRLGGRIILPIFRFGLLFESFLLGRDLLFDLLLFNDRRLGLHESLVVDVVGLEVFYQGLTL